MTLDRISTGIGGLDEILHGGLLENRAYLVRGPPGTGKTILGTQFLVAGAEQGESVLFVNLEETTDDVRENAASLGLDLDDVEFLDLSPNAEAFISNQSYDFFEVSDVEQEPFTETITTAIEETDPDRVFVDPITQLRYLTPDEHQFRKQAIGFMEYLTSQDATVLFTSQNTAASSDEDLQFLADGAITLDEDAVGHTIQVPKFRGSPTLSGQHTVRIETGGLAVYPELQSTEHGEEFVAEPISSGVPELDELLNGGIERGTVTVISGPTGVGKTTLGTQFMKEAAGRGERSVVYLFEENAATYRERSTAINIPVATMEDHGTLLVKEMEPIDVSPQEFAQRVRDEVETRDAELVMVDGTSGYEMSLPGQEDELRERLHALCRYLKNMGVTVILVDETHTVTGEFSGTGSGLSYLADNVLFLRHIERAGELQKVIGVLKKRTSDFEQALRELSITEHGLKIGEPLTDLRGILSGTPEWTESDESNTPSQ